MWSDSGLPPILGLWPGLPAPYCIARCYVLTEEFTLRILFTVLEDSENAISDTWCQVLKSHVNDTN